jgi:hypothetical protein
MNKAISGSSNLEEIKIVNENEEAHQIVEKWMLEQVRAQFRRLNENE